MGVNFNFKYYKELRLISLIISLYLLFDFFLYDYLKSIGFERNYFPSVTILVIMVFGFINSVLHRIPFLWKILMKVPLIRGEYYGELHKKINGIEHSKKCKMKILQTASKIKIDAVFWENDLKNKKQLKDKEVSESIVEDLIKNSRDKYELHFYYRTKSSYDYKKQIRDGYNTLIYDSKNKELEGFYFARNSNADGNGGNLKVRLEKKV